MLESICIRKIKAFKHTTEIKIRKTYICYTYFYTKQFIFFRFSYTFERIKENSEKVWHFEMYTVINDFEWRPLTPYIFIYYHVFYRLRKKSKRFNRCVNGLKL